MRNWLCLFFGVIFIFCSRENICAKDVATTNYHNELVALSGKIENIQDTTNQEYKLAILDKIIQLYHTNSSSEDTKICAKAIMQKAQILFDRGEYNKSLDMAIKGIKIVESNDFDPFLLSNLYLTAGNTYSVFEDHEKASLHYTEGLKYAKKTQNADLMFPFLNNLTAVCCYTKDIQKAHEYNNAAHALSLTDSVKQNFFYALNNGFIAMAENKPLQAFVYYKESIKIGENKDIPKKQIAASYSEIFKIYEEMGELDSAILYLEKYRKLAEEGHYMYMLVDSYKNLAQLYAKVHNENKATYYQNKYVSLGDSAMNKREFNRVKNKLFEYEQSKNDNYINQLTTTISTQKYVLFTFLFFLIVVIVLAVLIYFQKRKLQSAYHHLFERNKELSNIETKYADLIEIISKLKVSKSTEPTDEKSVGGINDEKRESLLKEINRIMQTTDYFCNPDFSLSELASLVESNTKYVSQIINETYGVNFRTFINEYRIKLSRKRLNDVEKYGNYTIKAVAESVGFKSQSNFISLFRKATGFTPSVYQNMVNKETK